MVELNQSAFAAAGVGDAGRGISFWGMSCRLVAHREHPAQDVHQIEVPVK